MTEEISSIVPQKLILSILHGGGGAGGGEIMKYVKCGNYKK